MKRRRKPQAKAAPRSKAQKRAALLTATGVRAIVTFAAFRQYYGSRRQGKSFVMLQHMREMQAQGRAIRAAVRQGGKTMFVNYDELERRALMHLDPEVKEAMLGMRDYHLERAAEKFGIDAKDVTPAQREIAKAENFFDLYNGKWHPAITNQKEPGDE